jgi:hypothetical protein
METPTPAPAEQVVETPEPTETVRDPQAVLKQNEELLGEIKKLRSVSKRAEGFDFEKAQAAMDSLAKIEEERLSKRGEYDKLLAQKQEAFEKRLAEETAEREKIQANLAGEKWENFLGENGVKLQRLQTVRELMEIQSRVELAPDSNGRLTLKLKDGVGDAGELKAAIQRFMQEDGNGWLFESPQGSGSGANGSMNATGGNAKTMPKAQWDGMDHKAQAAFIREGGKPVE